MTKVRVARRTIRLVLLTAAPSARPGPPQRPMLAPPARWLAREQSLWRSPLARLAHETEVARSALTTASSNVCPTTRVGKRINAAGRSRILRTDTASQCGRKSKRIVGPKRALRSYEECIRNINGIGLAPVDLRCRQTIWAHDNDESLDIGGGTRLHCCGPKPRH